jgi:thioredoxin-like negative regulator of GroEL
MALIILIAYWPILYNEFVSWDDDQNFLNNPYLRGSGFEQFRWAWSTFWLAVYQPLAWLILEVQYTLWGLNPSGYHFASIVMQIANACVLYLLTTTLLARSLPVLYRRNPLECFLGTGLAVTLYAVHPLRVEAVAWASCQPYLPCALFYMLSILAYLRANPEGAPPDRGWLLCSLFLFVAALLCKAVAVSLPLVMLILDYYPLKRLGGGPGQWFGRGVWRVWIEKLPYILLALIFMDVAILAKRHTTKLLPIQPAAISTSQVAQACYGIWFYLVKTVVPVSLTAFYPLPQRIHWFDYPFIVCILATLCACLVLFRGRRRWPGLLAAWLVYLAILTPNLGIIQISNQIAADRYCYVPLMSGVIVLSAGLSLLLQRLRISSHLGVGVIATGLAAIGVLVMLTRDQCRTWRSTEALWTHAMQHGGRTSAEINNFMGGVRFKQGVPVTAMAFVREALRLNPRYAEAYFNLGVCLMNQGQFDEAAIQFAQAVAIRPDHAEAHINLGSILAGQGKMEEAVKHYLESIKAHPENALAHKNLGVVLFGQGKIKEALKHVAEALWLDPFDPEADSIFEKVLRTYADRGDPAASEYLSQLVDDPRDPAARNGLITVLRKSEVASR